MARRKAEAAPEGKVELTSRSLEERVAALEATMTALVFSTFGARDQQGQPLRRCRCGCFATRRLTVNHPVAGMISEVLCSECGPATPLALPNVPREEAKLLAEGELADIERLNRSLVQARAWGGS